MIADRSRDGLEAGIFFTFAGSTCSTRVRLLVAPLANPAMPPPIPALPGFKVPNFIGALPGMTAMATMMMQGMLDKAKMPSIKELLEICIEGDVQLFACGTTMGVMGIEQSDLIPAAKCAGATTFLSYAADADVAMFI
jgi:peroxiredoxin family protein